MGEYALMFRIILCCAALIVIPVLGLSPNAAAAPACDDAECQTAVKSKPLDIVKFMREQAASTRVGEPRQRKVQQSKVQQSRLEQRKAQPVAHVQRPARHAVAARRKPATMPVEAAASYAAQQPPVQVVAGDELNDIDRAAPATAVPAEAAAGPVAVQPNVQLVDTAEFNDVDRKANDRLALSATTRIADAHAAAGQASGAQTGGAPTTSLSWLHWIWSAVGNVFGALATAMHQLFGL
jgi:hypothetical protein